MRLIKSLVCAVVICFAGVAMSNDHEKDNNILSVNGSAEMSVVPNEVHVSLMIQKDAISLADAQQQNDEVANRILRVMENSLRIDKKNIQTEFINVRPVYEYPQCGNRRCSKPEFSRFETKKGIFVKLKDIDKLQELLEKAIESGVTHIQSVKFATSNFERLQDQVQVLAAVDAKNRANRIANALGIEVGAPHRINVNQSYNHAPVHKYSRSMAMMESADSAGGSPNTISVGQITVKANISAQFLIK